MHRQIYSQVDLQIDEVNLSKTLRYEDRKIDRKTVFQITKLTTLMNRLGSQMKHWKVSCVTSLKYVLKGGMQRVVGKKTSR